MQKVTAFFEAARDYLREVVGELRKVVWPGRERAVRLTVVVVVMVAVISTFLSALDFLLGLGAQKFLGR